jgi:hypothetical protein
MSDHECYLKCDLSRVCSLCEYFQFGKRFWPRAYDCKVDKCPICTSRVQCNSYANRVIYYEEYASGIHWCCVCRHPLEYIYHGDYPEEHTIRDKCIVALHARVTYSILTKRCCLTRAPFLFRNRERRCTKCYNSLTRTTYSYYYHTNLLLEQSCSNYQELFFK